MRFWSVVNGQPVGVIGAHTKTANNVVFNPNNAAAYSVGDDGLLKFWTVPPPASRTLPGHTDAVTALTLSADNNQVLTASADKMVRGFTFANGRWPAR